MISRQSDESVCIPHLDDDGELLDQLLATELGEPAPLDGLTFPRDSVDFRRASQAKSEALQETYRNFYKFIDLEISMLNTPDSLLEMRLVETLDGIKRRSTVNLFNLFLRSGKLTEVDMAEPDQGTSKD